MSDFAFRFAPSPTGNLHIGSVRTAVYNWLLARRYGGRFVLRIEDTDRERSTDESVQAILEAMKWLGLDWDEGPEVEGPNGPYFQTQRTEIYEQHIQKLLAEGKAYRCYATKEEIEEMRQIAQAKKETFRYDRRWRDKGPEDWPEGQPYSIRFKAPIDGEVVVEDAIKGRVVFDAAQNLDDIVIQRSDGTPTYNLTVVVDDVTMGITHVLRGDDHLNNTPKQILLYEAFSYPVPVMAHMPLTLGKDKARLSKRHGATSVQAYRDMGILPHALMNYLVRLGWSHGDQELFTLDEMTALFSIEGIGKSAGVFDMDKLYWVNQQYIQNYPPEVVGEAVLPFLKQVGVETVADKKLVGLVEQLAPRSKTLVEMAEKAKPFYSEDYEYDEKADNKFLKADSLPILKELVEGLSALTEFTPGAIQPVFEAAMEAHELKLGKVAQPVRVAVTGGTTSPGIFETLELMGQQSTLNRLNRAIAHIQAKGDE